jgi:hypothetical protein
VLVEVFTISSRFAARVSREALGGATEVNMNPQLIVLAAVILLVGSLVGCDDLGVQEDIDVIVKVSANNYDATSFKQLFPEMTSHKAIASAFSTNYSDERRATLTQRMLAHVAVLGEDPRFVDSILVRHDCKEPGSFILPTYAERAHFNGRDVWLVQFIFGLGGPSFSHHACYAYSIPELEQLYYVGCR